MLSYFRINDPYRILGLLAILILVFIPLLIDPPPVTFPELKSLVIGEKILEGFTPYNGIIDNTAPLTNFVYAFMHFLFGESLLARHIIAALLIFAQAVFIGMIYIDKRVYPENSFVPSLIFGLLFIFSFDTLAISGELIGLFFILLALNSLFKEIEYREESYEMVLKMAVFVGIASLFSFSYIVFVPGALIILLMFTRTFGRKFLLLIIGFLIPHLLTISMYAIYDGAGALWKYFYLPNLKFAGSSFVSFQTLLPLMIIPVLFMVAALFMVNRESRLTKYQSQVLQAMFFWTVFSLIQVVYAKDLRPQSLITLIPGFSFFIAHFLLLIKRKMIAEIAFVIFATGLLLGCYFTRYMRLDQPAFNQLIARETNLPPGNRVVALEDNLNVYLNGRMSTPFLNWGLSRQVFENPEFYENVIIVYEGFKSDPPDLIIDPAGLMKPFMRKIPYLQEQYISSGEGYRRVTRSDINN